MTRTSHRVSGFCLLRTSRAARLAAAVLLAACAGPSPAGQLPAEYTRIVLADFDRGYVCCGVESGKPFDFTAPPKAVCLTNRVLRGGSTDYFRVPKPPWRFPLGAEAYSDLFFLGDGTVWLSPTSSVASVLGELGVVPSYRWGELPESCAATCPPLGIDRAERLSVTWYEATVDYVRVTWQNALVGRDPARPVSYQVELRRNGDFAVRFDLSRLPPGDPVLAAAYLAYGTSRPVSVRWCRLTPADMASADVDGDGIDTEREMFDYGTDPRSADTDGDSLYDLAESYSNTSPLTRDTDGDRFGDATDPHPRHLDWMRDSNGDGFPDVWVDKWFGGVTPDWWEDEGGDGIPNFASYYMGVRPDATWALGTHAPQGLLPFNMSSWRAVPCGFSFKAGGDFPVQDSSFTLVSRSFRVHRTSPWQQFFLMSDVTTYSGWSAGGIEMRWSSSSKPGEPGPPYNGSGLAPLETWDSFRIPLGDDDLCEYINIEIWTYNPNPVTGDEYDVRLDRPIFLVMWSPTVELGTSFNAYWSMVSPGSVFLARNDPDSGAYTIPCTVSYEGYPHVGGIDAAVTNALAAPMLPGVSFTGDSLVVDGPRSFTLPHHSTSNPVSVVVYRIDWPRAW